MSQFKIGFDAKRLFSNFTGLGNYSRTLVKNLAEVYPEHSYHLYAPKITLSKETIPFLENECIRTVKYEGNNAFWWRSYGIHKQLKKEKIDLFHGLSHEIPIGLNSAGLKSVVTIHDLIFKVYPEIYPLVDRKIYDVKSRYCCTHADRIIAISENTKKDIIRYYKIDPEKIEVVYQSCHPLFFRERNEMEVQEILKKYTIPSPYFLYVGSVERRKNLELVLEAYHLLEVGQRIPLVVIGKGKTYKKKMLALMQKYKLDKNIIWIHFLEDNVELKCFYEGATALIYPSIYEGFGLPVAEALLCKTPVIAANTSSLREAGGPGSLYIDPNKVEDLIAAMQEILSDPESVAEKTRMGYEYATKYFSKESTSHQIMNCYKTILHA